jgi:hypothetical protein
LVASSVFLLLGAAWLAEARAELIMWDGDAGTSDWGTAENWVGNVLPTQFDEVFFGGDLDGLTPPRNSSGNFLHQQVKGITTRIGSLTIDQPHLTFNPSTPTTGATGGTAADAVLTFGVDGTSSSFITLTPKFTTADASGANQNRPGAIFDNATINTAGSPVAAGTTTVAFTNRLTLVNNSVPAGTLTNRGLINESGTTGGTGITNTTTSTGTVTLSVDGPGNWRFVSGTATGTNQSIRRNAASTATMVFELAAGFTGAFLYDSASGGSSINGGMSVDQVTVAGGTLLVNTGAHITSANGIEIGAGGTLGGGQAATFGILNSLTSVAGTVAPGNPGSAGGPNYGKLVFNSGLSLQQTGRITLEIGGTTATPGTGTSFDQLSGDGSSTLTAGGHLTLSLDSTAWVAQDAAINLFSGFSSYTGSFADVTMTGMGSGSFTQNGDIWTVQNAAGTFDFDQSSGVLTVTAIPEPHVFAYCAFALGLMASRRRRPAR